MRSAYLVSLAWLVALAACGEDTKEHGVSEAAAGASTGAATSGEASVSATTGGTVATTGAGGAGSGGVTGSTSVGGAASGASDTTSSGATPSGGGAPEGTGGSGASTGGGGSTLGNGRDVFGIERLYPSAANGASWTSEHWASEGPYSITARSDENDPLGVSGMRGTGTLDVTGEGVLVMGGSEPRLYVYASEFGPWRDIEVTAYYQRVADDGTAWGGLVIGARSGPEGHGDTPCDAHTYYSRLRHDGATDFEKELMHTPSSTGSRIEPEVLWPPDGELPFETWIGYKYVIYNLPDGESIRLQSYRDLTGGVDGGTWELVNEMVDEGGWFTQTNCDEHEPINGESDLVYLGAGATLIRNTGVSEARYRWVSIREIAP